MRAGVAQGGLISPVLSVYVNDIPTASRHVEEHRACQPPLAEVPGYSFNESGQLQGRAEPGSKPKLFVPKQPTFTYLM